MLNRKENHIKKILTHELKSVVHDILNFNNHYGSISCKNTKKRYIQEVDRFITIVAVNLLKEFLPSYNVTSYKCILSRHEKNKKILYNQFYICMLKKDKKIFVDVTPVRHYLFDVVDEFSYYKINGYEDVTYATDPIIINSIIHDYHYGDFISESYHDLYIKIKQKILGGINNESVSKM